MKLIFITHPNFTGSQSMPRFAKMLGDGMCDLCHEVDYWKPSPKFFKLSSTPAIKKWLGYIDQYILFPASIKRRLKNSPNDTLFVFTDHALGPWVPIFSSLPHVVHCHDFLAQQSALGLIPENPTSWTGRIYQSYIRRGYSKGKNFISVSEKTINDLHSFIPNPPRRSEMVYNGLNQNFIPMDSTKVRISLSEKLKIDLTKGYLLHVGGNQWYKNRVGVIQIYNAWRSISSLKLPLLLVGAQANLLLEAACRASTFRSDIHLLSGMDDEFVRKAYAGAKLFIFPSLAEGFGWPIAEAMASGCPVITTGEAPMTEVAADAAYLIPKMPTSDLMKADWADLAANKVEEILQLPQSKRNEVVSAGLENAKRFDSKTALNRIEDIYKDILLKSKSA